MKIGILSAMKQELAPFTENADIARVHNHAMLEINECTYNSHTVFSLSCGVCKVNAALAAQILIDRFGAERVIMVGTAGAIASELHIADTVVSEYTSYHDVADEILTNAHPYMKSVWFPGDAAMIAALKSALKGHILEQRVFYGKIVSGEAFIDENGREEIIDSRDPLCVDMESAAVNHVCHVNGIPFLALRSISDTPQEHGEGSFQANLSAAANRACDILSVLLEAL